MSPSGRPLPEIIPEAYQAIRTVEAYTQSCGLDAALIELVKLRASQINGCAFCLDLHSRGARRRGESEQRLYLLNAWQDAPCYSERERAALNWTEHLTRLPVRAATATMQETLSGLFSEVEAANLTVLIGLINLWNRVALGGGFRLWNRVALGGGFRLHLDTAIAAGAGGPGMRPNQEIKR